MEEKKIEPKNYFGLTDPAEVERNKQIEDIAWQMFLDGLGIRLSRKLTSEEMGKITSEESYEYYRQKATKLYDKKQRALLNKKYPVIDIPASGNRNWSGGAYCLCFVYSKYKGNFVLRGYMKEIEEYLKINHTHYFCNFSLWHHGINRDIWHFWKKNIGIFKPSVRERMKPKSKRTKIEVCTYSDWVWDKSDETNVEKISFKFKRMPKRWIPEFDKF
jgi:hypothetical protein